jgi:hypothetical protein
MEKPMPGSTLKKAGLGIVMASMLTLAACAGDSGTPTSPTTQTGPPVSTPAPEPAPPPAPPTPPPTDTAVTVTGFVSLFSRSGPGDINVYFRISDTTFVEGDANTTVLDGSKLGDTTYLRLGQAVTVQGSSRGPGLIYARHIIITSR